MQKLGMLIAEKAWHSHFHHYWGKKEVKITHLSLAFLTGDSAKRS